MADALGTILNVIDVVQKAVVIYKKIQDCPEQMQLIGERMERLSSKLTAVKDFLQTQQISKDRTENIATIVKHISNDSQRVEALFMRWKNDLGPLNLQFRFKPIAQAYFALGSSAGEMKDLNERIEKYNSELDGELQLLCTIGINAVLGGMGGGSASKSPPSPLPVLPRQDLNVIFIDPYNRARGVVAEAYLKLVQDWTLRTGGVWNIKAVHSSGFFVCHRGAHNELIASMEYRYPSYKLKLVEGRQAPEPTALAALLDNKMFNYPFKAVLKQQMEARRSLGIPSSIFQTYDYILVFTKREYDNLLQLRRALIARDGKDAVGTDGSKGRIVHLGSGSEILEPKDPKDRAQWNAKCGEIKIAIKRFLTNEMGWKQPVQGAKLLF